MPTISRNRARSPLEQRDPGRGVLGFAALLAVPGLLALVVDPAQWLWRSWHDPSYQSDGIVVAGITLALLLASLLSGPAAPDARARRLAWWGLALTAAVRLAGRLLAVDTIGALALVVDVWAISHLLGVRRRPFALHPVVLALFSALALPVEHLAQRILGHPLQLLAASASERVLAPFYPELTRQGVLLLDPAVELAVDLPCSGARGLVLLSAIALGAWSRRTAGFVGACKGLAAVVFGAFAANVLRIVGLFVGATYDVPILEQPWHSLFGATALAIGAMPIMAVAARAPLRQPERIPLLERALGNAYRGAAIPWPAALALSVAGVAIASAPARPLDVTAPLEDRRLPTSLGRFNGSDVPLLALEKQYYDSWGGFAQKRIYDDGAGLPHTALLVRTRSPLRHLHGPDRCLIGAGHQVTRLGVVPGATPAVLYRSVAPDGREWRVEASFVSDVGEVATSVSEVVWRWLEEPDVAWSLVERISPWTLCEELPDRCREFEGALLASLDLPVETQR